MPPVMPSGEYPKAWPDIARAVKHGAGWCCQRCSHPNDQPSGYVLTVHHFDGNKANCAWWNLMALCQRCHLSVQARVDPQVPLMFDPTPWAMPHIAGFYEAGHGSPASTYDLARWRAEYERHVGVWPSWAPIEQKRRM
jgi:hypothetical protein